ncbi:hypothetical protein, partial [Paraburkholderia sediminicola]|uniref:hypothetical protein n=1 Tax=Paraburkholderia sediminicola TaxID=458836 RepID=UPI0038BA6E47
NANRPLRKQGKAKALRTQTNKRRRRQQPKTPFHERGHPTTISRKPKPLPQCPIARKRPKQQMNRK